MLRNSYNSHYPKGKKKAQSSQRKLKTIAGRLLRELERKLPKTQLEAYQEEIDLMQKTINQKRTDKSKTYSLHKPFSSCIAKGKAGKPYEFGNKIGLMSTMGKRIIITAIEAFRGNPHDSKTIEPLLNQSEELQRFTPKEIVYDRGGRGVFKIGNTKISTPKLPLKKDSIYQRRKKRNKFRRRAAIEPVIGHLKKNFRMQENYLSGKNGPKINALLAATGFNYNKLIIKLKEKILWLYLKFQKENHFYSLNLY